MPCRTFRSFCSINMPAFMNFEPAAPLCGKALQANRGEFIGQDEMDERLEQICSYKNAHPLTRAAAG